MRMQLVLAVVVIGWRSRRPPWRIPGILKAPRPANCPPAGRRHGRAKGPGSVWEIREDPRLPRAKRARPGLRGRTAARLQSLCGRGRAPSATSRLEVAVNARGQDRPGRRPGLVLSGCRQLLHSRFNPLEDNYRVYKVIAGKRMQLATADVPAGDKRDAGNDAVWHKLRIVHRGNEIRCWLDGKLLLEASDDAITQSGKVGLWTKADAVTAFDA